MRRWWRTATIAALLMSVTTHTAPASMASGTLYFPPFERGIGLSSSQLKAPCTMGTPPVAFLRPVPTTGRIDVSGGLTVRGCAFATMTRTENVPLGEVPEGLVGKTADVVAVIAIDNFRFVSAGWGVRTTHVGFAVGRKFTPTRRLLGYECNRLQGCTPTVPQNVSGATTITVTRTIRLPDRLWAAISVDARTIGSTGLIGSEFRATLVSVVVRWIA